MAARMYWLHAMTPLHVGSGSGVGFIDLPIMRESVTKWPYVPGSAFKGVLTDENQATPDDRKNLQHPKSDRIRSAFGVRDDQDDPGQKVGMAGSLVFTDARLVCLPVRSLYGTFAWCTSQLALQRLARDLNQVEVAGVPTVDLLDLASPNEIRLTPESVLESSGKVFFEDLDFVPTKPAANVKGDLAADAWSKFLAPAVFPGASADQTTWQSEFRKRFAIVSNNVFDFLSEMATEVVARVCLEDDTKIVKDGALWYEESLPAESILAGCVWCDKIFGSSSLKPSDLLNAFCPTGNEPFVWQLGGKASVGRGRVRCLFQS